MRAPTRIAPAAAGARLGVAAEGVVTLIAAVTGIEDLVGDVIEPGAIAWSLPRIQPKMARSHDKVKYLGRILHIEELRPGDPRLPKRTAAGALWPAAAGALVVTAQYNMATQAGRDAYEDAKFFAASGEGAWSIGYKVVPGYASDIGGVRHIRRLLLFEVSDVMHGAHPLTMTLEVKGADMDDLEYKTVALPGFEVKAPELLAGQGAMIAVFPPHGVARAVAHPDGTDPEHLHVTLAYLGHADDLKVTHQQLADAVADAVHAAPKLHGSIGGLGVFPEGPDGVPVYVPVDVPGLAEMRSAIVDAVEDAGQPIRHDHGWTPHLTRGYDLDEAHPVDPQDVHFGEVHVVVGDRCIPIPLGEDDDDDDDDEWDGEDVPDLDYDEAGEKSMPWNSALHPRVGSGQSGGGRFAPSGSGTTATAGQRQRPTWARAMQLGNRLRTRQGVTRKVGPGRPGAYVVRRGDNLWNIAKRHLGPGASNKAINAEWRRWYAANRKTIGGNPNLIKPGQHLNAPGEHAQHLPPTAARTTKARQKRSRYTRKRKLPSQGGHMVRTGAVVPRGMLASKMQAARFGYRTKTAMDAVLEVKALGGPAEHLKDWYVHGAGAAQIGWGTDGDFDRCVAIAGQHMSPDDAKGFCNLRHHDVLGIYPATHAKLEKKARPVDVGLEVKTAGKRPVAAGLAVVAGDTGRTLMLQRYHDGKDPAGGTWEFPGGCLEDGEHPLDAARREWSEETGIRLPDGDVSDGWDSSNGKYRGFVLRVPSEADVPVNLDHEDRHVLNPDDPDGDCVEVAAWFDPKHLADNPSVRKELARDAHHVRRALAPRTERKSLTAVAAVLAATRMEIKMARMPGSHEELHDALSERIGGLLSPDQPGRVVIDATFPTHAVATVYERDGGSTSYEVPFTADGGGLAIGEPSQVGLEVVAVGPGPGGEDAALQAQVARFLEPAASDLADAAARVEAAPLEVKQLRGLKGGVVRLLDALAAKGVDVASMILGDDDEDDQDEDPEGDVGGEADPVAGEMDEAAAVGVPDDSPAPDEADDLDADVAGGPGGDPAAVPPDDADPDDRPRDDEDEETKGLVILDPEEVRAQLAALRVR